LARRRLDDERADRTDTLSLAAELSGGDNDGYHPGGSVAMDAQWLTLICLLVLVFVLAIAAAYAWISAVNSDWWRDRYMMRVFWQTRRDDEKEAD
jgi:hypothetical protein